MSLRRIAIVHPSFASLGGAENVILWLTQAWSQAGYNIDIITCEQSPELTQLSLLANVSVHSIKLPFVPPSDYRERHITMMGWRLAPKLKNADVINVHNFPATLWVDEALNRLTKTPTYSPAPVLWSCHEPYRSLYADQLNDRYMYTRFNPNNIDAPLEFTTPEVSHTTMDIAAKKRDQAAVARIDKIVCNSAHTASLVTQLYNRDADARPFGIPLSNPSPAQRGDLIVISTVARLEAAKNIHVGLQAIAKVCEQSPALRSQLKYQIIGTGSLENDLKTLSANLGIDDVVDFLGFVANSDLQKVYRDSHFMLYIPINEPLGLVPIEAGAQRTPSIASNQGGPLETVEHGKSGWHVDPEDPDNVAAAILRWCNDLNYVDQLGENAFDHIRTHFNIEDTATALLSEFSVMALNGSIR